MPADGQPRSQTPANARRRRPARSDAYDERCMIELEFRRFEPHDLPSIEPWFDDAETRRWLGDSAWPRQALELQDRPLGEFRGERETGRHQWLAWDQDALVGYIDCGTTDRWNTWDGGPEGRGVIEAIPVPSAALAYVVNPAFRRRGHGKAMLQGLVARPELAHIELFGAGIEPENLASVRCLADVGFSPLDPVADWEGIVYYVHRRTLSAA
jgi:RimJ/RimL family protein N-acetyltransferase